MVTLVECVFWEKTDSKVTFISCCVDGGTKQMFVFLNFVRACFFLFYMAAEKCQSTNNL